MQSETPRLVFDYIASDEREGFGQSSNGQDGHSTVLVELWQSVLDQLSEEIALLDEDWNILLVNKSWTLVAELYGSSSLTPGTNYLQFCQKLAAEGLQVARDVVAGLQDLSLGKARSFELDYGSSQPEGEREYRLRVNLLALHDRTFALLTRYDVTGLVELRNIRSDFSEAVLREQAGERLRIGREVHDATVQHLTALGLSIEALKRRGKTPIEPRLDEMQQLLAEAQREIRSISYLAHPPVLDEGTLPEALQSLLKGFARRTGLETHFEAAGEVHVLNTASEAAAYRIVQEALSNIYRHALASQASVYLCSRKSLLHVVIADDGVGIAELVQSGVGLGGMRSRLAELGGRLSIRSRSPGTNVIASIPID